MKKCETCKAYEKKDSIKKAKEEIGRCKRHAPVAGFGFPAVSPSDWCGDHKLDENKI